MTRLGICLSLLIGALIGGGLSLLILRDAPAVKPQVAAPLLAPSAKVPAPAAKVPAPAAKAPAPAAKAPAAAAPAAQVDPKLAMIIVALCDNEHQGIVPVPEALGRGDDPATNLYWGAMYGLRTLLQKPDPASPPQFSPARARPILRAPERPRRSPSRLDDELHGARGLCAARLARRLVPTGSPCRHL